MGWTGDELKAAKIVHGPTSNLSDTYRLTIQKADGSEKRLDVPGFMVGDQRGAALRMRAAKIILERLMNGESARGPGDGD